MKRPAIVAISLALASLLTGCASTVITYERTAGDVTVRGTYRSTKNLTASVDTNGVFSIVASASEATDANTRLVKQVTASVLEAAALAK